MKIIGIGGTNGSGKDTFGEILRKDFGWFFISVSDLLRHEASRRSLEVERRNLRKISAEWREKFGVGVLMDKAVEEFEKQKDNYSGLVISNLRNPGEADEIHKLGGKVVWVDADQKVRYQRIEARLRSAEDHKTYEQFIKEEQEEMGYGGDENSLHMAAVKAKADIFIENNSNDVESFKKAAQKALSDYL
jgi:dephospho-CoA kinase